MYMYIPFNNYSPPATFAHLTVKPYLTRITINRLTPDTSPVVCSQSEAGGATAAVRVKRVVANVFATAIVRQAFIDV